MNNDPCSWTSVTSTNRFRSVFGVVVLPHVHARTQNVMGIEFALCRHETLPGVVPIVCLPRRLALDFGCDGIVGVSLSAQCL